MRPPRDVSPGAGARRSLLADLLAALVLALLAYQLAAGIGVVGFLALLTLLALVLWIAIETTIRKGIHRRRISGAKGLKRPSTF